MDLLYPVSGYSGRAFADFHHGLLDSRSTEHVLTDRNFDFIADTASESIHVGTLASRIASHFRVDGYLAASASASASDLRRGVQAAVGFKADA